MLKSIFKTSTSGNSGSSGSLGAFTFNEMINNTSFNTPKLSATCTDRGNAIFDTVATSDVEPNGFTIIQSAAVPTISFKLRVEGAVPVRHVGINGLATRDDGPAFNFLAGAELPVKGNQGDKYLIQTKIIAWNKNIDWDMGNATFIEDTAGGQTFQARNNLENQTRVTAYGSNNVNGTMLDTLTLASSTAYKAGDVIKIVSDDMIRPNSNRAEYRAEFAIVTAKTASTITLDRTLCLISASSTNIRVARLVKRKFSLRNARFALANARTSYGFAYHVNCEGYIAPQFFNLHAESAASLFIRTQSCYGAHGSILTGDELPDDVSKGRYGYGVADYGSQNSHWRDLKFGQCRHAYTTGADDLNPADNPSVMTYGGAVRCHVWSGTCTNPTNFAWDTHPDAFQCEFHDVHAEGGRMLSTQMVGGFQDRGVGTKLHKLHYVSNTKAKGSYDVPIYYNNESKDTEIGSVFITGSRFRILNHAGAREGIFSIKHLDITAETISDEIIKLITKSAIVIDKIDYRITQDVTEPDYMAMFDLNDVGSLTVKELNFHLNKGGVQAVNAPNYNVFKVDANNHRGVTANVNFYCGTTPENSLSNCKVITANGNKINTGRLSVKLYSEQLPAARTKEVVFNLGEGSGVIFDYEAIIAKSANGTAQNTRVGSVTLTAPTSTLSFGPNGYPWNREENRYSHERLIKHLSSNSASHKINKFCKPAFDGQELSLYVHSSSQRFVVAGDCDGLHSEWSSSDVIFEPGRIHTFIAKWDSAAQEVLWSYMG